MEKSKKYLNIIFDQSVLREALSVFQRNALDEDTKEITKILSVHINDELWRYDDLEEFYSAYAKEPGCARFSIYYHEAELYLNTETDRTIISVKSRTRSAIESVFSVFEQAVTNSNYTSVESKPDNPFIFIGHGRSKQWRELKDHLSDQHGYTIQAYEVGARAGHTVRDILEDMLQKSSFACLVMTGEDETEQGDLRARQNVIHEIGLFQGRLGFARAIVLVEKDVEEFSNIQGIHQIRYSKNNIRETFGDVLATLKREFG